MRLLCFLLLMLSAAAPYTAAQVNVRQDLQGRFLALDPGWNGRSFLGVSILELDSERAKQLKLEENGGVEVKRVEEGSPAQKAGIKAGDVLLSYNGENLLGAEQLGRLVRETPEGRHVKVQLWRDGKTQTITVVTELRPSHQPTLGLPFPPGEFPDTHGFYPPDIPSAILTWYSPALGIQFESVTSQLADFFGVKQGVLIRAVTNGSSGEKGGLKTGDVLVRLGEHSISNSHDVYTFLRAQASQGKAIQVIVVRERKELRLAITPDTSAASNPFARMP